MNSQPQNQAEGCPRPASWEIPKALPSSIVMVRIGPALVLLWYQTSNQVLTAVNKIGIKQQTREIDPEQVLIPDDQEE